jgi:membrane associated rhomboid family serine protease
LEQQMTDQLRHTQPPVKQPLFHVPVVVIVLITLLFLIHAGLALAGEDWQVLALYAFSFIPARLGPEPFAQIPGSAYWSFLTYGFLHGSWPHLILNSLWLLIFSSVVARRIGAWRYLLLCALTAIAGALVSLFVYWGERIIMVGASAAVSGVMAAAIPIMFSGALRFGQAYQADLSGIRVLKPHELLRSPPALGFSCVFLAMTLLTGAVQTSGVALLGETQIAWEAHLGGFLAGLMLFYLLDKTRALPLRDL